MQESLFHRSPVWQSSLGFHLCWKDHVNLLDYLINGERWAGGPSDIITTWWSWNSRGACFKPSPSCWGADPLQYLMFWVSPSALLIYKVEEQPTNMSHSSTCILTKSKWRIWGFDRIGSLGGAGREIQLGIYSHFKAVGTDLLTVPRCSTSYH